MITTTTDAIQEKLISQYLGLVSHEVIVEGDIALDEMERSTTRLKKAKEKALQEVIQQAERMKADAVVGIRADFEPTGNEGELMYILYGTAVKFERFLN